SRHYARLYEISEPELGAEDMAAMMSHDWPGNVRELRHVAERRILAAKRGRGSVTEAIGRDDDVSNVPETLREAVAAFERQLIGQALRTHGGRMDAVAEALGIGRRTLNEKIVKLGLNKAEHI
ncbi:MAG: helix-turn-helix domain-containing protein, partial [Pseudomonadota bacterium]